MLDCWTVGFYWPSGRDVELHFPPMEGSTVAGDLIRFEDFELDLRAYQLRRSGRAVKLERIPMEVLYLLVERRGQLVTREEIIEKLWGKDVFLDTDNAINTAIRKIRQVLKDDPEQPRFVQTITGKGYRFIAPVTEPGTKGEAEEREGDSARAARTEEAATGRTFKSAGCCSLALPLLWPRLHWRVTSIFTARQNSLTKTPLSLPISRTRRAIRSSTTTLRQGLAVQLAQSPFLSSYLRRAHPADAEADGQASRRTAYPGGVPGNLRTNCKRRCSRRLDC